MAERQEEKRVSAKTIAAEGEDHGVLSNALQGLAAAQTKARASRDDGDRRRGGEGDAVPATVSLLCRPGQQGPSASDEGDIANALQLPPSVALDSLDGGGCANAHEPAMLEGAEVESVVQESVARKRGSAVSAGSTRLTLSSLMKHAPVESEAEAYVQRALDDVAGFKRAQNDILRGFPADSSAAAFAPKKNATLPLRRSPEEDKHRNRSGKISENLYALTQGMLKMQRHSNEVGSSFQENLTTHADTLANFGLRLIRRHGKSVTGDGAPRETVKARSDGGSDNTQAFLRQANRKKTDEEEGAEKGEEPDEDRGGDSRDHSSEDTEVFVKKLNRRNELKSDYQALQRWFTMKRTGALTLIKWILFGAIVPATLLAAILFYVAGNPPCNNGICQPKTPSKPSNSSAIGASAVETVDLLESASASWWLLFLVRQSITFSAAFATQKFVVEYIALGTKGAVHLFGPLFVLVIAQSRGWPITLFFWAVYDFLFLYGRHEFAMHWLFWQDKINLMNASNPSGTFTYSRQYTALLALSLVMCILVAIKRCWVGINLGRNTYARYGEELAELMKNVILIGEVAFLARDIEKTKVVLPDFGFHVDGNSENLEVESRETRTTGGRILEGLDLGSSLRHAKLNHLLGEFEEPEEPSLWNGAQASIWEIIQFRRSLSCLKSRYPFSVMFGPAMTRQDCVESAEAVYNRLMISTPGRDILNFDVIAVLAMEISGDLNEAKVRDLIHLFRPDREGNLSLLDFAKSVDSVHKQLRLLRANIANSSRLSGALETIIDLFFYILIGFLVLAVMGIDPLVLFASFSGFIIGFSFMIGSTCSYFFQGLVYIFVRQPYEIGDKVTVDRCWDAMSPSGCSGWIVKDITLSTTTLVYTVTNEVATHTNGYLAQYRTINSSRSPNAILMVCIKFPIKTPSAKIEVFKAAVEKFIADRPREWLCFIAFRLLSFDQSMQYVEYKASAQHRETWQGLGISNSRADLQRFALDLAKTMEMEYIAPVSRIAYQQVSSLQRHGEEGEVFDGDGDDDVEEVSKNASTNRRFV